MVSREPHMNIRPSGGLVDTRRALRIFSACLIVDYAGSGNVSLFDSSELVADS